MKVILQQDIAKVGRRHEVVDVANGYARNRLIPRGYAIEATDEHLKNRAAKDEQIAADLAAKEAAFENAVSAVADEAIEIQKPANESGHLFAALTPADVVDVLQSRGVSIDESQVHIGTPIKEVGTHHVQLVSGNRVEPIAVTINGEAR